MYLLNKQTNAAVNLVILFLFYNKPTQPQREWSANRRPTKRADHQGTDSVEILCAHTHKYADIKTRATSIFYSLKVELKRQLMNINRPIGRESARALKTDVACS